MTANVPHNITLIDRTGGKEIALTLDPFIASGVSTIVRLANTMTAAEREELISCLDLINNPSRLDALPNEWDYWNYGPIIAYARHGFILPEVMDYYIDTADLVFALSPTSKYHKRDRTLGSISLQKTPGMLFFDELEKYKLVTPDQQKRIDQRRARCVEDHVVQYRAKAKETLGIGLGQNSDLDSDSAEPVDGDLCEPTDGVRLPAAGPVLERPEAPILQIPFA